MKTSSLSIALAKPNQLWLAAGFGLFITLISLFLWQNSQVISKTYGLQLLRERANLLKKENQFLENNVSQENALANLEKLVSRLNMEKVQKTIFIQSSEASVVAR